MKKTGIIFLSIILMIMSVNISVAIAGDTEYSVLDESCVRLLGRGEADEEGGRTFNWPNAGVEFEFSGTKADLFVTESNLDDSEYDGSYFTMAVYDGNDLIRTERLKLVKGYNTIYTFKEGDPTVKKLMLVRSSEACRGTLKISKIKADAPLTATRPRERRIEFIGDSYTAGYGNSPQLSEYEKYCSQNTDNWNSYTGFVSRHYNAESSVIAYMGKGVYANRKLTELNHTMSHQFNYEEIYTDTNLSINMSSAVEHDFTDYQPHVVTVWLGTNDIAAPVDKDTFKTAYIKLLDNIRKNYPDASIICMSIPKNNMYYNTIADIVNDSSRGAKNKYYFMPVNNFGASGVDSHPNVAEDMAIARELIEKIDSIPGIWEEKKADDTQLVSLRADYNTGRVRVYGNVEAADENVAALVLKSETSMGDTNEENTQFVSQTKSNADGNYEFEFKMNDISGEYAFYINTKKMNSPQIRNFSFRNVIPSMTVCKSGETVNKISQLKAGDVLTVKLSGFISENNVLCMLAAAQYSGERLTKVDMLNSFDNTDVGIGMDCEIIPDTDKVKIMYWNADTYAPLMATYVIE